MSIWSSPEFWGGLITAGGSLAQGLFQNSANERNIQIESELARERLAQDRELTLAQIAASQGNAALAAETAKEVARRQIAGRLAGEYGSLMANSSLARAEGLKNKDVDIPQSISAMFARIR